MKERSRFLLAAWDGGGVVSAVLGVAQRLVARGHEVIVLADPTVEPEARAAGCAFTPWLRAPHRTSREREADLIPDWATRSPIEHFQKNVRPYFIDSGAAWTSDVLAAIDAHRIDMVLCDFMIPWAALAAEVRGLPHAVLVTHPYPLPTPGVPPQGSAMVPAPGFLAPLRDAAFRRLTEWVFDRGRGALNEERARHGLAPLPHALDQQRRADAVLVLTAPAFDYPGPAVPRNVHWVGPVLADPAWCASFRSPWPADDARPLVVVGMSSTFQDHAAVLSRMVAALATLPVRGIVSRGPTIRAHEVEPADDVVVVDSVPHAEVLPQAALLVTHCGHGTALKGLAAGVPMVCVPHGRDQDDNAARVVGLGAGLSLKKNASVEQIRRTIERALATPSLREAAQRLARTIAIGEGQRDAVEAIEDVLRVRAAPGPAVRAA